MRLLILAWCLLACGAPAPVGPVAPAPPAYEIRELVEGSELARALAERVLARGLDEITVEVDDAGEPYVVGPTPEAIATMIDGIDGGELDVVYGPWDGRVRTYVVARAPIVGPEHVVEIDADGAYVLDEEGEARLAEATGPLAILVGGFVVETR